MNRLSKKLASFGPLACVAVAFSILSTGWMSIRLFGLNRFGKPLRGASADIVAVVSKLNFKPLFIFDSGVLVARPPVDSLSGKLEGVPDDKIEDKLRKAATLELEYKATGEYSIDFKKVRHVAFSEKDGRNTLHMKLPQPRLNAIRWTNEGDPDKWDFLDGDDKEWGKFLNQIHNRELFVEAAVRRNYDNEEYRAMAREKAEKILRVLFGAKVTSPENDIVIEWE